MTRTTTTLQNDGAPRFPIADSMFTADPERVAQLDEDLRADYVAAVVPDHVVRGAIAQDTTVFQVIGDLSDIYENGDTHELDEVRRQAVGRPIDVAEAVHMFRLDHAVRLRDLRRRQAASVRPGACPVCGGGYAVYDGMCQQDSLLVQRIRQERADLALLPDGRTHRQAVEDYLDRQ